MQGMGVIHVMGTMAAMLLGLGGLVRGWQMGKGRLDLITDWDNRVLPNPAVHAPSFARVYFRYGGITVISPMMLWLGLPAVIWGIGLGALVWFWFEAIEKIAVQARSNSTVMSN